MTEYAEEIEGREMDAAREPDPPREIEPFIRILTVQQPAAAAILSGAKDVENRTWGTKYRGIIAIHAGAEFMTLGHPFLSFPAYVRWRNRATQPQWRRVDDRRAIVALTELVDVHDGRPGCCLSVWAESNPFPVHWVLRNTIPLDEPLEYRGGLGLRRLPTDVAVEACIRAGLKP